VHLVDKLHDPLAVRELHRSFWRIIQAVRVWPQVGLGEAHQVEPLSGAHEAVGETQTEHGSRGNQN
tara:strand:- start:1328 stop:1525 length:198 start_codon:yes stop_codon:yes gene_type:complete